MINVNEKIPEFHLQTLNSSYILRVLPTGHLINLHYGHKIKHRKCFDCLYQNYSIEVGNETNYNEKYTPFTLETAKLEISSYGKGDYREPAIHLNFADNSRVSDFKYKDYNIFKGKIGFKKQPEVRSKDNQTLQIILVDKIKSIELHLFYKIIEKCDVIVRSAKLINKSNKKVKIEKIMSFNLDLDNDDFEVFTLSGKWIKEGQISKQTLNKGTYYIDSKRGVSSSEHNPFLGLNNNSGEVYGFSLIYSGNHQGLVEINSYDIIRIQMGINPFDFQWLLDKGEKFQTPEVMLTFSKKGFNGMSHNFHQMINDYIIPSQWRKYPRPIVFNNWEATYFDFDEETLLELAKKANKLGMELFVLDDGWFGRRNDDSTSLGDWYVNYNKIPSGLKSLSKKINEIGLDFGLWIEPEMISIDSKLYEKHPDWAVKLKDREPSLGRNQLLLDLCNPEVVDYLDKRFTEIFSDINISYVKWDMNRNFSDIYSSYLPQERQQEFYHRYILALYDLMQRLTTKFPGILFEGCASGGNRYNPALLYYMPQVWTSDNTDAIERLKIQYGTSFIYPTSTMGAHVSDIPNHQVRRNTPLESRFNTAAFGILGYELDIRELTTRQEEIIKEQIKYYKKHRQLLQYGRFYRIENPFTKNKAIWMVVSENQKEALVGYYQRLQESNPSLETIRLKGLDKEKIYKIKNRDQYITGSKFRKIFGEKHNSEKVEAYGDELIYAGFKPMSQYIGTGYNQNIRFVGDFGSRLYYLTTKK